MWADNFSTAEGNALHEKAHSGQDESRPGVRIVRALPVWSDDYGLQGVCDVVEIHKDGVIIPIEYKRGRPKNTRLMKYNSVGKPCAWRAVFNVNQAVFIPATCFTVSNNVVRRLLLILLCGNLLSKLLRILQLILNRSVNLGFFFGNH